MDVCAAGADHGDDERSKSRPVSNIALFHALKQDIDVWGLVSGNISRLPRLTIMLVSHVGWCSCPYETVERIKCYVTGLPAIPTTKGIFVTIQRRGKLAGCLGTFAGIEGDLIEKVMLYTLRSTYEDSRFSDHQLRSSAHSSEAWMTGFWTFTTTVLDTAFEIHPDDFWLRFAPGKHGIILKYKGKSATFLPKVVMRWWPTAQDSPLRSVPEDLVPPSPFQKLRFEEDVFGALFKKWDITQSPAGIGSKAPFSCTLGPSTWICE
jgi:hypothetical protein